MGTVMKKSRQFVNRLQHIDDVVDYLCHALEDMTTEDTAKVMKGINDRFDLQEYECPVCGTTTYADDVKCSGCGASFDNEGGDSDEMHNTEVQ